MLMPSSGPDPALLNAALEYAELGFPVFPCIHNGKRPAVSHGLLEATTDEGAIEKWWTEHPDWNVAISTKGLYVIDVDPDGLPWLSKIPSQDGLPCGAITLTPRGGRHFWFRQPEGCSFSSTASSIHLGVDTRGDGGYVLVPPSEINGKLYSWIVPLELASRLPVMPQWLLEKVDPVSKGRLGPPLRDSTTADILPGQRNKVLFRFAANFRRAGMNESEIFTAISGINASRCQPPLPDNELQVIARSAVRFKPDFTETSLILTTAGVKEAGEEKPRAPAVPATPAAPPAAPPLKKVEFPADCLQNLPPVMQEAMDWMLATAIHPQPVLNLGALITLFGTALGQKVEDNYGTRTNVLLVAIAPTGAGKEHPRQCCKKLLVHALMEDYFGSERIGSSAGIVSALDQHPVRLFLIDEIGRLLKTMRDPGNSHLFNIGTVLMHLYTSSNATWIGDAYADVTRVKRIDQPHLCVYGTSVPENLFEGLTPANLKDGFMGRLMFFESSGYGVRQCPQILDPPERVLQTLSAFAKTPRLGAGNLGGGNPHRVPKTKDAHRRHEQYCQEVDDRLKTDDPLAAGIWCRAAEKAAKLALIHACCLSGIRGPIGLISENWGIKLANHNARYIIQAAANNVAENLVERNLQTVFRAIGEGACTGRDLANRARKLKHRERMEILQELEELGAISVTTELHGDKAGRPKTVYRRLRATL